MKHLPFLLIIILCVSCLNRNSQDYYDDAFHNMKSFFYEDGYTDRELNKFKLLYEEEDSTHYFYHWFQIADTGDTALVDIKITKRWPYTSGSCSCSYSVGLLNRKRRSLRNLFDTTVVTTHNLDNYMDVVEGDTVKWIVDKEKMVDHIRKGHYSLLKKYQSNRIVRFYIEIGVSSERGFKTTDAIVRFKKDCKIELEPISLPDSFYNTNWQYELGKVYEYEVQ